MTQYDVRLLIRAANEFRSRGEARSAEPLLRRAVVEAALRPRDRKTERDLPAALNALGVLCKDLARYDEARALYDQAVVLLEESAAPEDHDVATLYHNLGGIEHARGNYAAAERIARRGLALRRQLGDDEAIAADLIALGAILDAQRKFDEAEAMYLEGLAILERAPNRTRAEIAVALNNLGAQYVKRGRIGEGIDLLTRSARIKRECLGGSHPDLAVTLNNIAVAHKRRGDPETAQPLFREAVAILETAVGADHPKTTVCRNNLSPRREFA